MTTEEKQLLLIDLCARLPYCNTWVEYDGKKWLITGYGHGRVSLLPSAFSSGTGPCPLVEEVRPYLRPMSSMTKEERLIYEQRFHDVGRSIDVIDADDVVPHIDWLLSRHLDFRGLIPMGFALEATEGMYKQ